MFFRESDHMCFVDKRTIVIKGYLRPRIPYRIDSNFCYANIDN